MPYRACFAGGKDAGLVSLNKCSGCGLDSVLSPPGLAFTAVSTMNVCEHVMQTLCFQHRGCI